MKFRPFVLIQFAGLLRSVICARVLLHQHDTAKESSHVVLLHRIGCELASRGNEVLVGVYTDGRRVRLRDATLLRRVAKRRRYIALAYVGCPASFQSPCLHV